MKKFLTSEEAIELLPEGEEIHTFYNFPFGLVGADWEREDIIERLNNPNYKIEVCGEAARAMNHGICVYKKGETIQSNILFIETNMDKLNEIDPLPEKKEERPTVSEKFVSLDAYKQVSWERDIAIQQLHELGYELGQKIEPTTKNCESCRNYGSHNGVCDICEDYNCFTEPNNSTTKNDLGVDAVSRKAVLNTLDSMDSALDEDRTVECYKDLLKECYKVLPSVTPQEPILEKINKMKSEIASSLEFWDYSPNNNPLARDILETLTYFWGDVKAESEG